MIQKSLDSFAEKNERNHDGYADAMHVEYMPQSDSL
jgi:hypothetical protein